MKAVLPANRPARSSVYGVNGEAGTLTDGNGLVNVIFPLLRTRLEAGSCQLGRREITLSTDYSAAAGSKPWFSNLLDGVTWPTATGPGRGSRGVASSTRPSSSPQPAVTTRSRSRALSERAGVSSRTIYANFPSLDSLLIVAIAEQSEALYQRYTDSPPRGRSPAARVNHLISELTETMTANRALTVALLRALLSGKRDVSQFVHGFGSVLQTMLASAIAPDGPTRRDRQIAEILEGIWFSALIGWATGPDSGAPIDDIMRRSTRACSCRHADPPRPKRVWSPPGRPGAGTRRGGTSITGARGVRLHGSLPGPGEAQTTTATERLRPHRGVGPQVPLAVEASRSVGYLMTNFVPFLSATVAFDRSFDVHPPFDGENTVVTFTDLPTN